MALTDKHCLDHTINKYNQYLIHQNIGYEIFVKYL